MNLGPYTHSVEGWIVLAAMILLLLMTNACHEGGHALVAWWAGDRRRSIRRRCTLNPIVHFHWLLTLVLPVAALWLSGGQFMVGGARPVLVDRSRTGRAGMALTALAGPAGNFLCAGFLMAALGLFWDREWFDITRFDQVHSDAWAIVKVGLWFSVGLGLLNLIPLPGLDGGHVVGMCLPGRVQRIWYLLTPLGLVLVLLLLLHLGGFTYQWGLVDRPPSPNPFLWLADRLDVYTGAMKDFWGSVL